MPAEEHLRYVPEPSAVDLRGVAWPALGVLALLAVSVGGLYAAYDLSLPVKTVPGPQTFPIPRIATHEAEITQLRRLTAEQKQRLDGWRWGNDQHTIVEIPIGRAMQLLVQKGGEAWTPLAPAQPVLASPTAGAQRAVGTDGLPQQGSHSPSADSQKKPGPQP
jgi:hypothetical protein